VVLGQVETSSTMDSLELANECLMLNDKALEL
jgi:hypothetical protein